ncbi:MAG: methylmalonyl Co-A mutase-associated GTPase MeaB [Candidatus Lokiarchaeota archaeon]|nr:methylmalonyl Co-A mutase-associated GTPase MeaB [Candidatus Lokiarchaeota archaeon]
MNVNYDIEQLCKRFKEKDKIALSRLITLIENDPSLASEIFKHFNNLDNESYIIGITGSPGAGKSTLTGQVAKLLAERGKGIGIISIDPTSPFSGGAFLGDRIRMSKVSCHPNVFIRSMASRGHGGGISRAVFDITLLYEAFGIDIIIIETVGVGQAELDIYNLVYTTIVIQVPNMGDAIQIQKAGIIEIGDIYDVNKKDLGGEDIAVQIELMLDDTTNSQTGWRPPVLMTNSVKGDGIEDLVEKILEHKEYLERSELLKDKKKKRYMYKIRESLVDTIENIILDKIINVDELDNIATKLIDNKFEIYQELNDLFNHIHLKIKKD